MPTKKAKSPAAGSRGEHTPVTNEETVREEKVKPASTPPSTGSDDKINATKEGLEIVKGFEGLISAETAAEMFEAPDTSDLRDIGEASFGPPPVELRMGLETVHGIDNRVQITNTTAYPWRAIASLAITAADNSAWIGTGWFIGPRTVLTAGHCVFIKNSGVPGRDGWVKSIRVMPGRNGSTLPFGSVMSSTFRSVSGWTTSGNENFDYGVIILPTPLGNTVGTFGYGAYTDADLRSTIANIAGYPGDKPSGTNWFDARRVASVTSQKVFYDIDTAGGQSGGPVFRVLPNGNRMGIAIHAYGGAVNNSGTRINNQVLNNLNAWRV
jgi:V8-like Glu-specific endopeptidase